MSKYDHLSVEEIELIGRCPWAAVEGSFIPDEEFHTLMDLERHEMKKVAESWPQVREGEDVELAVNNALNNLCGYPHNGEAELKERTGAAEDALDALLDKIGNRGIQ